MFGATLIPALIGALVSLFASVVGRAVVALGIGFVTYKGIAIAIGIMKDSVMTGISSLSADAVGLVGFLWIDKALTVVFSAVAVAIAMKGIGGSVKKMVLK